MTFWLLVQMLYHLSYWRLVGVRATKLGSRDKHPASLPANSPGHSGSHAGWEKEGELATMSLEFEFHLQFPCGSPLTELSDFCQVETSPNVNKN